MPYNREDSDTSRSVVNSMAVFNLRSLFEQKSCNQLLHERESCSDYKVSGLRRNRKVHRYEKFG